VQGNILVEPRNVRIDDIPAGIKFFDGSEGHDGSIFVRSSHDRCVLANAKVIVKCDCDIGMFPHILTFPSGAQRQSQLFIIGMFLVKNFLLTLIPMTIVRRL
jgi:hypothetical protein